MRTLNSTRIRAVSRIASAAAVLAVFALAAPAFAAPDMNGFVRAKGEGAVALSYTSESYDEFWLGRTKVQLSSTEEVETQSLSLYFDYGITDKLTFVANLPYIEADDNGIFGLPNGRGKIEGNQDLSVLAKYRFCQADAGPVHFDFVAAGGMTNPASNYVVNTVPVNIGDGVSVWNARLVGQLSWQNFYISQQLGYDLRGGDAPDQIPLYTEAGYTWGPVTFNVMYSNLNSTGGTDIGDPGFTFSNNDKELERLGAKVYGRIGDHFGLAGSYFQTLSGGRNVGDTTGWSLGAVLTF
jgi:hypothetical protein